MSERVLAFPDDLVVGHLGAYRGDTPLLSAPARGRVRVPADAEVYLSVDTPVLGLGELARDAVYWIKTPKHTTTDADLGRLSHLTGLRELNCSKARPVTDAGVACLAPLTNLKRLDLYWSGVTDAGLRHLAGMSQLEYLHLGMTRVKGPGLAWLIGLQRLRSLSLEVTDVDDSCVPHLLALGSLERLTLFGTRLSTKGLSALREAIPGSGVSMGDPGQRLARERSRRAVLAILARRLLPDLPPDGSPEEALRTLLPAGSKLTECRFPGSKVFRREFSLDDLDVASRWLPKLFGRDLRIVTPGGLDVWIPWLRPRRADRRGQRKG